MRGMARRLGDAFNRTALLIILFTGMISVGCSGTKFSTTAVRIGVVGTPESLSPIYDRSTTAQVVQRIVLRGFLDWGADGAMRTVWAGTVPSVKDGTFRGSARSASYTMTLRADSDLVGLALALPPPLRKPATEAWPLRIARVPTVVNGMEADEIRVSLGAMLDLAFERLRRGPQMTLSRGSIALGDSAVLPTYGVSLNANFKRLDLDTWLPLASSLTAPPAAATRRCRTSGWSRRARRSSAPPPPPSASRRSFSWATRTGGSSRRWRCASPSPASSAGSGPTSS